MVVVAVFASIIAVLLYAHGSPDFLHFGLSFGVLWFAYMSHYWQTEEHDAQNQAAEWREAALDAKANQSTENE